MAQHGEDSETGFRAAESACGHPPRTLYARLTSLDLLSEALWVVGSGDNALPFLGIVQQEGESLIRDIAVGFRPSSPSRCKIPILVRPNFKHCSLVVSQRVRSLVEYDIRHECLDPNWF